MLPTGVALGRSGGSPISRADDVAIESEAELRELAAAGVAAWNDRRLDDYYAGFAPEMVFHGPGAPVAKGVDALRAHCAVALTAFPDLVITTEQIVVDLNARSMASRQIEVGTHTGDLVTPQGTLPPTGRAMSMSGATFAKVDKDGLIVEMFEYFDRPAMTEGLSPG